MTNTPISYEQACAIIVIAADQRGEIQHGTVVKTRFTVSHYRNFCSQSFTTGLKVMLKHGNKANAKPWVTCNECQCIEHKDDGMQFLPISKIWICQECAVSGLF